MGGLFGKIATVAGTALGGPVGGAIGGALGGFGSKALGGGDLTDSLGGAAGGAVNGASQNLMSSFMKPHNPIPMGGPLPSANLNQGANFLSQGLSNNGVATPSAFHDLTFTPSKPTLLDTLNARSMN